MGLKREVAAAVIPFHLEGDKSPGNRIDIETLYKIFKLSQSSLGIAHIGLHVSKNFRISNYGYAGSIFSTCDTISDAILCAEKYGCLAHTLGKFCIDSGFDETDSLVKYVWTPSFHSAEDEKYRQITECVLSNYLLTINWLSWGVEGHVHKLTFRHAPKEPIEEYSKLLNCSVEFNAEQNALYVEREFLESPIPTANPLKLSLLQQKLNRHLAQYNSESDLIGRVEYTIEKMMPNQRPTLALVAAELSLTERSLKRYLKQKETKYQRILASVKMDLCAIYRTQNLSFAEISQRLWYADQSAFTRAYKNWHGASPSKHFR